MPSCKASVKTKIGVGLSVCQYDDDDDDNDDDDDDDAFLAAKPERRQTGGL